MFDKLPLCLKPAQQLQSTKMSWLTWRHSHLPLGKQTVSCLWTSLVPENLCVTRTQSCHFPNASAHRKVSLGIMVYLRGIKNVLDRLAASLIPRSHSSHYVLSFFVRVFSKCRHDISNCHGWTLHRGMLVSSLKWFLRFLLHTIIRISLLASTVLSWKASFTISNFLKMAIVDKEV